jgi:formylglycine-generating enzyme required for sulfatase activity
MDIKNLYCAIAILLIVGICFSIAIKAQPRVAKIPPIESSTSVLGNSKWKVRLSSRDRWFDTKINVPKGSKINIQATGFINWGPPSSRKEDPPSRVGPNGTRPPGGDSHQFPMLDAGCGSLIMRIGSSLYAVGEIGSISVSESGTIQLMVNDDILSDNSGSFSVEIEIPPSPNPQCNNANGVGALIPYGTDNSRKTPLILIHGIHGTKPNQKLTENNWYWEEFITKRFDLDESLNSKYALYIFQYRSDIDYAQLLGIYLGCEIDRKIPERPFVILAHSFGGLVAKNFMVFYHHRTENWKPKTGGETALGLITLGTPHHGTPGANDPNALQEHFTRNFVERGLNIPSQTWKRAYAGVNFAYWDTSSGLTSFFEPPAVSSESANRSDLRWDNFDSRIKSDVNIELQNVNRMFEKYRDKVIIYAGILSPEKPIDLTQILFRVTNGETLNWNSVKRKYELLKDRDKLDHRLLSFADGMLYYGLGEAFGNTDGLVPFKSSLFCDPPPYLTSPKTPNFECGSKYRVRRFEPGERDAFPGELPDSKTISIKRSQRGYDHKDMYEHSDVLDYVVLDLINFVELKDKTVRKNSIGMELVYVPPGEFMMGLSESDIDRLLPIYKRTNKQANRDWFIGESPQRRISMRDGFWMGRYEVTHSQWKDVMGNLSRSHPHEDSSDSSVHRISWKDAKGFIDRLNAGDDEFEYRLPSAAEWEYAARAGTTMTAFGKRSSSTPNAWALFDMDGGLKEFCEDKVGLVKDTPLDGSPFLDPQNGTNNWHRVVRGCSFTEGGPDCRVTAQMGLPESEVAGDNVGFRIAARLKSKNGSGSNAIYNVANKKPVIITTNNAEERDGTGNCNDPKEVTDGLLQERSTNCLGGGVVGYQNNDYNQPMEISVTIDLQDTFTVTKIRYNPGDVQRAETWNADVMTSPFGTIKTIPGTPWKGAWTEQTGSTIRASKITVKFRKTRTQYANDWLFIGEIEVFGYRAGQTPPETVVPIPSQRLGLRLDDYCRSKYGRNANISFISGDVYSWRCVVRGFLGSVTRYEMDMDEACRQQHGVDVKAVFASRTDHISWYCTRQ